MVLPERKITSIERFLELFSKVKTVILDSTKAFSAQRVVCEHAHAGIKRYNSVTAIYRNRVTDFDDRLMLTATGIWNIYLEAA